MTFKDYLAWTIVAGYTICVSTGVSVLIYALWPVSGVLLGFVGMTIAVAWAGNHLGL